MLGAFMSSLDSSNMAALDGTLCSHSRCTCVSLRTRVCRVISDNIPFKQKMKMGFKDIAVRSANMGKNFAIMGCVYSAVECNVERVSVHIISATF